jgi:hypothetical protein
VRKLRLGNKLTGYLLVGVLAVSGLDLFLSLKRTRENLLGDVRREVTAIGRTIGKYNSSGSTARAAQQ